jgi:hypothetical protein
MNHPFSCMVAGPTKAGKTMFVKNLIERIDKIIDKPISKIYWFYAEDQPAYNSLKSKVIFINGVPNFDKLKLDSKTPKLIILDDLMHELKGSGNLIKLFTRGCHHWNVSIIQIVQNAFYEGLRTARINCDYLALFKNPGDRLQAAILARQLFPTNTGYFLESYADATSEPHGYLFIDLTQYTPDKYRLKTDIFSPTPTLYVPNL